MRSSRGPGRAWMVAAISFCLGWGCASSAPTSPPAEAPRAADSAAGPAQSGDIRATIDAFLTDPGSGDPRRIMRFAVDSPDVSVVFRQSILEAEGASDDLRTLMLAAFTAGNVRAQLEAGKNADMPVPGVRAMVAVYRWLRAKKPDLRVELYETYAAKEAEGTLEAFVLERATKE